MQSPNWKELAFLSYFFNWSINYMRFCDYYYAEPMMPQEVWAKLISNPMKLTYTGDGSVRFTNDNGWNCRIHGCMSE